MIKLTKHQPSFYQLNCYLLLVLSVLMIQLLYRTVTLRQDDKKLSIFHQSRLVKELSGVMEVSNREMLILGDFTFGWN